MKKIVLSLIALALLAACRHPEIGEFVDFDAFNPTLVQEKDVFTPEGEANPEIMFPDEPGTHSAARTHTTVVREALESMTSNTLTHVSGTYTGHDIDGSPLLQSGKIIFPSSGPIKNIILVCHYTICANFEAPSESFPMEGILASKGYALVIADYIGYGATAHRIHPYMHISSTAQSVVDFALVAKPYLESIGRKTQSEDVIVVGYSQGGAIALGVMDLLQSEYRDVFPIKKVYAGGGPYDLAATFDISMEKDHTGIPCAIPMIVQGMDEGESLGLDMADFFQPRLLENYQEWINSKKYTINQIGKMMEVRELHELITESGRDKKSPETAKLYKAMMINSTLNFKPTAPLHLFHSKTDDTVPFVNAQKAEITFKYQNVRFDFADYGSHAVGALIFLKKVADDL